MNVHDLPLSIFSLIGEYLTSLTLPVYACHSLKSWRNFCNSCKSLSEVKHKFACYNLTVLNSYTYITYYDDDIDRYLSNFYNWMDRRPAIARLLDTVADTSKQTYLTFRDRYSNELILIGKKEVAYPRSHGLSLTSNNPEIFNILVNRNYQQFLTVRAIEWNVCHELHDYSIFKNLYYLACNAGTSFNCTDYSFFSNIKVLRFNPSCDNDFDISPIGNCYELEIENYSGVVSPLANVPKLSIISSSISDVSSLGRVQYLDLSYCVNIVDVSALGNVKTLKLSYCDLVTDIRALGNVQNLYLFGINNIQHSLPLDNTVKALYFEFCSIITQDIKHYSMKRNKKLVVQGASMAIWLKENQIKFFEGYQVSLSIFF
jgi:hypothetical protein